MSFALISNKTMTYFCLFRLKTDLKYNSGLESSGQDFLWRDPQRWSMTSTLLKLVGPTEKTLVQQPVRVLDDGKHQTGRRANARHGPKWMEEADVTLYAEQCSAGDLSQVSQSGDWSGVLLDEKVGTCKDVFVGRGHECIEEWRKSHSPYLFLRR